MKRSIPCLIAAALALPGLAFAPATPVLAYGPGFDCAKATRQIDKAICAWDTVATLDASMAAAYKTAMAVQNGEAARALVRAGQRAWLAERDRRCGLDTVQPKPGSEEGLDPREFGQLVCLQAIYPPRIARLMDIAAPPLTPRELKTVQLEPLKAAYPEDGRQAGYQVLFSPDKSLMALGVEDGAGYVEQVWLYQPASGRLVVASARTHRGKTENPGDISGLDTWTWGRDGRFYLRAKRPLGESSIVRADMEGYAELRDPPSESARIFADHDAATWAMARGDPVPERKRPPGFDDDSHNEQDGGAFVAWAQNKGHGSFDLMAARDGDDRPRIIASGGWELERFLLDPGGRRLFYNGQDGLVVTDPDSGATRRLKGTRGTPAEVQPLNLSADGDILVYSATGACSRDATDEIDADADGEQNRYVCLAYLQTAGKEPEGGAVAGPFAGAGAAPADSWVGKWTGRGAGALSAVIRRGTARPDYLVIDLYTAAPGCSGAVTLYGKPTGTVLVGASHDPGDPAAPVCRVELSLDGGALKTEVAGPCAYYHGGNCGFDGFMKRGE